MDKPSNVLELTADIVANFVSNNTVASGEIAGVISSVHKALSDAAENKTADQAPQVDKPTVGQIRKSITPDGLISFLDGKRYKTLRRHLTTNGTNPEQYRERYGLPRDYPMVAPSYSEQRSSLAKQLGLGRGVRAAEPAAEAEQSEAKPAPTRKAAVPKNGRAKRASA